MYTPDKCILRLIDVLIFQKNVKNQRGFCLLTEIPEASIARIRNGEMHFTVLQIEVVCQVFNVNANWVFGMDKKVFNDENSIEIKDFISPKAS